MYKTEKEMREAKVPEHGSIRELAEYLEKLVMMDHDYGTCVYAMSMAATATFNYVAGRLGVTGFQASCADLDFLKRVREWDHPFIILQANDDLYPQYDLHQKLEEARKEWRPWLREQAVENLKRAEDDDLVSPRVREHWQKLVSELSDEIRKGE